MDMKLNGSAEEVEEALPTEKTVATQNEPTTTCEPLNEAGEESRQPAVDNEPTEREGEREKQGSKQARKRNRTEEEKMEVQTAAGASCRTKRQAPVQTKGGAILCHNILPPEKLNKLSDDEVARELARCLQEPKLGLLKEVVEVLGVEKAVKIYHETSDIQDAGGVPAADGDGDKKKSPGGVFFALVKTATTDEERKKIFKFDKEKKERRRKMIKKKRDKEKRIEMTKRKAEWQLKVFRSQLDNSFGPIPEPDWDIRDTHKRQAKNIHKRLGKKPTGGEMMEVETYGASCSKSKTESNGPSSESLDREKEAAEEFERMLECDMDLGIDIT